jgi:hypothetical protein
MTREDDMASAESQNVDVILRPTTPQLQSA